MTEKQKRIAKANGTLDKHYSQAVVRLIRKRYTANDELAIIRQRDEKPDEFAAFNAYAEECKVKARATIYGGEVVPR